MDSYQPIYDAVRSRIHGADVGQILTDVARDAFSIRTDLITQEFCIAASEHMRPSAVYRPSIARDGNKWEAMYGSNLMDGVCGYGDTPEEAMRDFDNNWRTQRIPEQPK